MGTDPKIEETAIVVQEQPGALIRPIADLAAVMEYQEEVARVVGKALKPGRDFDTVPGANKPSLYQPGAERLMLIFSLACDFEIVEREIDHAVKVPWSKRKKKWANKYKGDRDFTWITETGESEGIYRYVTMAVITNKRTGIRVGSALGAASTLESKYIDRPRDCENTCLKMAQKRAMVSAVKCVLGLSDRFTVDVEDTMMDAPADDQPADQAPRAEPAKQAKPAKERTKEEAQLAERYKFALKAHPSIASKVAGMIFDDVKSWNNDSGGVGTVRAWELFLDCFDAGLVVGQSGVDGVLRSVPRGDVAGLEKVLGDRLAAATEKPGGMTEDDVPW